MIWTEYRKHGGDCARCRSLADEAIDAARREQVSMWTSIDGEHGAQVYRKAPVLPGRNKTDSPISVDSGSVSSESE